MWRLVFKLVPCYCLNLTTGNSNVSLAVIGLFTEQMRRHVIFQIKRRFKLSVSISV